MTRSEACEILGVSENASSAMIRAAYKLKKGDSQTKVEDQVIKRAVNLLLGSAPHEEDSPPIVPKTLSQKLIKGSSKSKTPGRDLVKSSAKDLALVVQPRGPSLRKTATALAKIGGRALKTTSSALTRTTATAMQRIEDAAENIREEENGTRQKPKLPKGPKVYFIFGIGSINATPKTKSRSYKKGEVYAEFGFPNQRRNPWSIDLIAPCDLDVALTIQDIDTKDVPDVDATGVKESDISKLDLLLITTEFDLQEYAENIRNQARKISPLLGDLLQKHIDEYRIARDMRTWLGRAYGGQSRMQELKKAQRECIETENELSLEIRKIRTLEAKYLGRPSLRDDPENIVSFVGEGDRSIVLELRSYMA